MPFLLIFPSAACPLSLFHTVSIRLDLAASSGSPPSISNPSSTSASVFYSVALFAFFPPRSLPLGYFGFTLSNTLLTPPFLSASFTSSLLVADQVFLLLASSYLYTIAFPSPLLLNAYRFNILILLSIRPMKIHLTSTLFLHFINLEYLAMSVYYLLEILQETNLILMNNILSTEYHLLNYFMMTIMIYNNFISSIFWIYSICIYRFLKCFNFFELSLICF